MCRAPRCLPESQRMFLVLRIMFTCCRAIDWSKTRLTFVLFTFQWFLFQVKFQLCLYTGEFSHVLSEGALIIVFRSSWWACQSKLHALRFSPGVIIGLCKVTAWNFRRLFFFFFQKEETKQHWWSQQLQAALLDIEDTKFGPLLIVDIRI